MFYIPSHELRPVEIPLPEPPALDREGYDINALRQITKGRGVKIAVLDSGIDSEHLALRPSIETAANFTDSSLGFRDESGHGTHVAGVIAARQRPGGMVGVAPEARLYIGKVIKDPNEGSPPELLVDGIDWAISQGVHIINVSLGREEPNAKLEAALKRAKNAKIFVICAAGNRRDGGLDFPARYPNCVAVGAVDFVGKRWEDERPDVASAVGPELDIAAYGEDIISTLRGGGYGRMSGTSTAAPFVTGVIALALAKQRDQAVTAPVKTLEELLARLSQTAQDNFPGDQYIRREINPKRFFDSI